MRDDRYLEHPGLIIVLPPSTHGTIAPSCRMSEIEGAIEYFEELMSGWDDIQCNDPECTHDDCAESKKYVSYLRSAMEVVCAVLLRSDEYEKHFDGSQ